LKALSDLQGFKRSRHYKVEMKVHCGACLFWRCRSALPFLSPKDNIEKLHCSNFSHLYAAAQHEQREREREIEIERERERE
jgi:hypothetical protein